MRLSVVIPGYLTQEADWQRCLDSVLQNIGPLDEVICVDDASPRPPIAPSQCAEHDSRVRMIRLSRNCGQAAARNKGLELATGEFVAFVDSDDELLPRTYDLAFSQITTNTDIVVYGVRTIWDGIKLFREDVLPTENLGELNAKSIASLYNAQLFNYPWNKIYRRSFLIANGIRFVENAIPREDEVFNIDCVLANARYSILGHIGHIYHRQDGTSLARYRRFGDSANRIVAKRWSLCRDRFEETDSLKWDDFAVSEESLLKSEWHNIWRLNSPYSLIDRFTWLREHSSVGNVNAYFKMLIYAFMRRYFYFPFIQKWHVCRLYPDIQPIRELKKYV